MKNTLLLLVCLLVFSSCIKDEIENNHEAIFNFIWTEMDERYGGFIPRNINWDSLYTVYHPQAQNVEDESQLWDVCTRMLDVLDDQHVSMSDNIIGGKGFASGKINDELVAEKEFRLKNIINNYLQDDYVGIMLDEEDEEIQYVYGTIEGENIGYIYMPNFGESNDWYKEIDTTIEQLKDTDGLIVDVRNNGGGLPVVNRYVAGRFMETEKYIFSVQTRNGPEHDDFEEPIKYYSTPEGETYTKPIIALINHSTVSAGEEFMIFMQSQDHVTVLGSPTSNAFSATSFEKFLPNGWYFKFPTQLYLYPDGTSPEGVGIIPDIYQVNDTFEVNLGIDRLLESAVELLN